MNFRASKLVTEQYGQSTTQYGWEDPREALPTNAPAATTDSAIFLELQLVQNAEEMDCVPKPIIHSCARPASSLEWASAATWESYTNMIRQRTGSIALEEYQLDPMTKKIRRESHGKFRWVYCRKEYSPPAQFCGLKGCFTEVYSPQRCTIREGEWPFA